MTETFESPEHGGTEAEDFESEDAEVVTGEVIDDASSADPSFGQADIDSDDDSSLEAMFDDPLAKALTERDDYLDALRRMQAEFENYRKRTQKQQSEEGNRAARLLVEKLLPVLDVLDLASAHLGDAESNDAKALTQAAALLNDVLAKEGLERVDPVGTPFDPTLHEAVGQAPALVPDDGVAGGAAGGDADGVVGAEGAGGADGAGEAGDAGPMVAQVMRAGYLWRGTVVRPAMVLVRG